MPAGTAWPTWAPPPGGGPPGEVHRLRASPPSLEVGRRSRSHSPRLPNHHVCASRRLHTHGRRPRAELRPMVGVPGAGFRSKHPVAAALESRRCSTPAHHGRTLAWTPVPSVSCGSSHRRPQTDHRERTHAELPQQRNVLYPPPPGAARRRTTTIHPPASYIRIGRRPRCCSSHTTGHRTRRGRSSCSVHAGAQTQYCSVRLTPVDSVSSRNCGRRTDTSRRSEY